MLFELARPLDELEDMLLEEFAGRTMRMGEIYEVHNYGRKFIDKNYKNVLTNGNGGKNHGDPAYNRDGRSRAIATCAD